MQWGFCFDQTRCIGCNTCVIACKDWHDIQTKSVNWRKVTTYEKGKYPEVRVSHLSIPCNHCGRPSCMQVCPANAITKTEKNGIVLVNREKCLGKDTCGMLCKKACPYGAPQFGEEPNAKMQKCDFCIERFAEEKAPICVEACPMRALDAGPLDKLIERYGETKNCDGFVFNAKICPSTIFRTKLLARA